jgi:hypothetical protein
MIIHQRDRRKKDDVPQEKQSARAPAKEGKADAAAAPAEADDDA